MSTLRINNIEAKSVPASATIDEKVKITNSSGDTLVFIELLHVNYHRTEPPCPAQQIEMEDDW